MSTLKLAIRRANTASLMKTWCTRQTMRSHSIDGHTQPVVRDDHHTLGLAHNGNLINAMDLYSELCGQTASAAPWCQGLGR